MDDTHSTRKCPHDLYFDDYCEPCEALEHFEAGRMLLKCPKCMRKEFIPRFFNDPEEAARLEVVCPGCDIGDFSEHAYFDINGSHITRDLTKELEG